MVTGYNATFTTGRGATSGVPDLAELVKAAEKMRAERERLDADLVAALRRHIAATRLDLTVWSALTVWADLLRVPLTELLEVLDGIRPPSWDFWEGVRRVFEPGRRV